MVQATIPEFSGRRRPEIPLAAGGEHRLTHTAAPVYVALVASNRHMNRSGMRRPYATHTQIHGGGDGGCDARRGHDPRISHRRGEGQEGWRRLAGGKVRVFREDS